MIRDLIFKCRAWRLFQILINLCRISAVFLTYILKSKDKELKIIITESEKWSRSIKF